MPASRTPKGYRLADGEPATGWQPAPPARRAAAGLVDAALLVATLRVGWVWWNWHTAARAATPGQAALGLMVFATDTRRPATRPRMLLRGGVYHGTAVLIGVATLGIGWLYALAGALGENRRTLYDEWAQVVVLARPDGSAPAQRPTA